MANCVRTLPLQRSPVLSFSGSSAFTGNRIRSAPLRVARLEKRQTKVSSLFGLGVPELAVIAGVAALIFGPSQLPEIGKGLGKTVKSFQSAAKEFEKELKEAAAPDEAKAQQQPMNGESTVKKEEAAPKP